MTIWFTSDHHFGHKNIIAYSRRPFRDVEQMNEELVRRHNEAVRPMDYVWHLGDFALDERLVPQFLRRMNGRWRLVCGNHDRCHRCHRGWKKFTRRYVEHGFEHVMMGCRFVWTNGAETARVQLSHMPSTDAADPRYPEWRPREDYDLLLHGHVHERYKWRSKEIDLGSGESEYKISMINVGVDQWDFAPVSLEQLMQLAGYGPGPYRLMRDTDAL